MCVGSVSCTSVNTPPPPPPSDVPTTAFLISSQRLLCYATSPEKGETNKTKVDEISARARADILLSVSLIAEQSPPFARLFVLSEHKARMHLT